MILKYQNPAYGAYHGQSFGFLDKIFEAVGGVVKSAADLVTAPARVQNEQLQIQQQILQTQVQGQQYQSEAAARITQERADSIKTLALAGAGVISIIAVAAAIRSRK